MQKPFSHHPKWRENFEFKKSYPSPEHYKNFDATLVKHQQPSFILDPIINQYTAPNQLQYKYSN